ncbi:NAD(P)H-quinone oxidoreductase [soil metagenome]
MTVAGATMRAVVITRPGGPEVLEIAERPLPLPAAGEIRVRVRAAGLNRAALLQRRGSYPAPPGFPADVPGLEYAGEVDALGEGAGLWAVGNRVMGIVGGGAQAEYVCVHEREAIRVPQELGLDEAAAIPEAFVTAFDALVNQLGLKIGEHLLIHAVGSGVGTAALQLGKAMGATVIGTSRTAEKLKRATEFGMDAAIDTSRQELAEAIDGATGGEGLDAVLDLVGGALLEATLPTLASGARVVLVGTVAGSRAEFDLGLLLRRRVRVIGTVLRSRPLEEKIALARSFSRNALPLFIAGRVRPVVDSVLPFTAIGEAHRRMEENDTFGKIVLSW